MRNSLLLFLSVILIFIGVNPAMAKYETPEYKVIKSEKAIEVREYPSYIVAEVSNSGQRDKAANESFMNLL